MRLRDNLVRAPLSACALIFACQTGGDSAGKPSSAEQLSTANIRDNEVRKYIEDSLVPYLTRMAYELCTVRVTAAPRAPRQGICIPVAKGGFQIPGLLGPEAEGVTKPPTNHPPSPYPADSMEMVR